MAEVVSVQAHSIPSTLAQSHPVIPPLVNLDPRLNGYFAHV
jgi:hypothetical protein